MKPTPTKRQLEFLDWELGIFFHFGIRSFFPGHKDWDGKPMPASAFNPTEFDPFQWVRLARNAGATYCILTCKHHDGFANWPSKRSDYSVAQSDWEGGRGDVVKTFVEACRKYNMKVGLYYSPAQWGGTVKFSEPKEYDDYFIEQISELLTNYGKIDYLWFDGCGSENHEYDKARIIKTIRGLQPEILIFSMWDPDSCWVGNEDGYSDLAHCNAADNAPFSMLADDERSLGEERYLPAECDLCLRNHTWFDCEANEDEIKSVDELLGIWEQSVGRGANMLLNIGPDSRGLLPEPDAKRLEELGNALRERYATPLSFTEPTRGEGNVWSITAKNPYAISSHSPIETGLALVDTVVIEEDITNGDLVEEFRIYAHCPGSQHKRALVYLGLGCGHKQVCRFPTIKTPKLVLEVTKSSGEVVLRDFKAYYSRKND